MGRRSKDELIQSNYYEWLEDAEKLRAKKKDGFKLTKEEKELIRNVPTVENPYSRHKDEPPKKKPKAKKVVIDFDKNVVWPATARSFLCAVYNIPYTDEQCLLFCEREDCPFYQVGYFRAHGVKY